MKKPPKIRCAIYTRKSHEEGLDQEFNSLDAQRVAAEAYVQSQMHEGWEAVATRYDDGGFSGGTIERPALQQLLADIKAGKIDVIVVYKVDRLSRSLMDFSKLVEIFDAHSVSFVSVTQAFNTTNSMGRLTLNILLSFAQFEREVTGERIRDKFAASKKKGMWMGGVIPLGYDVRHRKLVVNDEEAQRVRFIYKKYLELKSVEQLRDYLNEQGHKAKSWITQSGKVRGGGIYSVHGVCKILSNQIYIGKIHHKGEYYDGEHEAIILDDVWDRVQQQLKQNFVGRLTNKNRSHDILLKSKITDASGNAFVTTYTKRNNKRYHYYLNKVTKSRIGVAELNTIVSQAMGGLNLNNVRLDVGQLTKAEIQARYETLNQQDLSQAVDRVLIHDSKITIVICKTKLAELIAVAKASNIQYPGRVYQLTETIDREDVIELTLDIAFRRYAGRKIGYTTNNQPLRIHKTSHDTSLIQAIVRSYKWNQMLEAGEVKSVKQIALMEKIERTYVGDVMRLKYLAPEITTMIMNGTQPRNLNVSQLIRQPLPLDWQAQKILLNIA